MQSISSSLALYCKMSKDNSPDESITCDICGNVIEACTCSCPYCGEREDDFIFYISIDLINNLEKNVIHCLFCPM